MAKVVSNRRQLSRLVELMEKNLDIAKGISTKTQSKKRWEEFSLELNSLGPPERSWEKWQRVWVDLKCKIKKKRIENKTEIASTRRGTNKHHMFNNLEEGVISILNLETINVDQITDLKSTSSSPNNMNSFQEIKNLNQTMEQNVSPFAQNIDKLIREADFSILEEVDLEIKIMSLIYDAIKTKSKTLNNRIVK